MIKILEHFPDYENTTICGSSMGGFTSAYISSKYPNVFSKVGVFSIASWLCEDKLLKFVSKNKINEKTKFFIQVGTSEDYVKSVPNLPQIYIDCSINYLRVLLECGVNINNIHFGVGQDDRHEEKAWAKYMKKFILF